MPTSAYDQLNADTLPAAPISLGRVGACPDCGCPIYGPDRIFSDEKPTVVMSCRCSGDLTDELED